MVELLRWWYGPGWVHLMRSAGQRLHRLALTFSMPILVRTLFAPWRRIISYGNQSFADGLRAILDNAISRLVGFCVRVLVLIAASFLIILSSVVSVVAIIAWPLLPVAAVALIVRGVLPW